MTVPSPQEPRILVGAILRNEQPRWLGRWLDAMLRLADRIVIVDDASTDGTADACAARGDRVIVHRLSSSLFHQESVLRSRLWDAIRSEAAPGDWIGLFDGDEIPSEPLIAAAPCIRGLPPSVERLDAHLAEMWDERSYRVDGLWSPWISFFVRFRDEPYLPSLDGAPALHASRVPDYTNRLVPAPLDAPVLHLGYSRAEDRRAKADFYLRRNTGTNLHHARTILSPPALRPLAELLDVPDLLVAVPIRDRAWMVPALTGSLDRLAWPRERLRVVIQLNDSHDETGELLDRWVQGPGRGYAEIEETSLPHSVAGDHEWAGPPWDPDGPLKRMTQLRNRALELLRCTGAGALLSLDSDVILDPRTASHLHATGADIISPVFWAGWRQQRDEPPPRVELPEWLAERPDVRRIVAALRQGRLPQVWERGQYELSADLLLDLIARRGIHDVGGLGAATWIRREVAEAGLRYDPIPNLPSEMQGEDRHFCVRAACEGFRLRATSYLPAVHCDDAADLERVAPELEVPLRGTRWPTVWEPAGVPIEGEPRERTRRPEAETRRVQAARART